MVSLGLTAIQRVKVHFVKCPRCKFTIMVNLREKVCPVCGGEMQRPEKR